MFAPTFHRRYCAEPTVNDSGSAVATHRSSPTLNVFAVWNGVDAARAGFSIKSSRLNFGSRPGGTAALAVQVVERVLHRARSCE